MTLEERVAAIEAELQEIKDKKQQLISALEALTKVKEEFQRAYIEFTTNPRG